MVNNSDSTVPDYWVWTIKQVAGFSKLEREFTVNQGQRAKVIHVMGQELDTSAQLVFSWMYI